MRCSEYHVWNAQLTLRKSIACLDWALIRGSSSHRSWISSLGFDWRSSPEFKSSLMLPNTAFVFWRPQCQGNRPCTVNLLETTAAINGTSLFFHRIKRCFRLEWISVPKICSYIIWNNLAGFPHSFGIHLWNHWTHQLSIVHEDDWRWQQWTLWVSWWLIGGICTN